MRFFICFSYRGTAYQGSQVQPNAPTVQGEMERAFALVLRRPVPLMFAGRTDTGVHAEEMWAHFDLTEEEVARLAIDNLPFRLNGILPDDIAIHSVHPVTSDAHARFTATARTYQYRITAEKNPFLTGIRTRVRKGLDFDVMNSAAQVLLGRQDFRSFSRTRTDVRTFFCTISRAEWTIEKTDAEGNVLEATFTITADRFLRNMVRAVVGTLMEMGYGRRPADQMPDVIAQQNRCAAGESAPAEGLFLTHVEYPTTIFAPNYANNQHPIG